MTNYNQGLQLDIYIIADGACKEKSEQFVKLVGCFILFTQSLFKDLFLSPL